VKSGDLDLVSPVRQSSIPRSGSFTEARKISLEGQTGLGRAQLAGLRWWVLGRPLARRVQGQTPVILRSGEVERERGRTVEALASFIGAGEGNGTGSTWRDAGHAGSGTGRALASSGHVEHVEVCFYPCSKAC
jgi:hypothetical protein